MTHSVDFLPAAKSGTNGLPPFLTAAAPFPWSAEAMRPRRDWIFSEVRRCFRPFVDDNGRWLSPPAPNRDPDPRVLVQVAVPYWFGSEQDKALAANLLLSESVTDAATRAKRCAFTPEYIVTLLKIAGDLVPRDLRNLLVERVGTNLDYYICRDLRHHGFNDNHVTLATATLILGGEEAGNRNAVEEGRANLLNFRDTLMRRGFMHETNDCYIPHSIYPLAALGEWSNDEEIRELARNCEARLWADWIGHWHINLARKPGPSARDYTGGRLNPLSTNTALWSIFGDAFGQPVFPPSDSFSECLPAARSIDFEGTINDYAWNLGFIPWIASHHYHIPQEVAELMYERAYPHVICGTHEVGHFSEMIHRPALQKSDISEEAMPFSAREIFTYQYQEADWAMGTASQRMIGICPNNNWGIYYRKNAPLARTADQGLVFCSFTINEKDCTQDRDFAMDPLDPEAVNHEAATLWFDNGRYAGIQHERTSILLYRPRTHEQHEVHALSTTLLFPLCFGNQVERVELGDHAIDDFSGQSDQLCDVFVQDGPLYIGIRPLMPVDLPADIRVKARREGPWGVIDFYSYRGPALDLAEVDLCRIGGGFLCEVATREDFATLDDFKAWFRAGNVVDEQDWFMRHVRYHREGLDLGLRWDVWADNLMYRSLNGREYPTPKFKCSGLDPRHLPWLLDDVSGLDHFSWLQRQSKRKRVNWPDTPLTLRPAARLLNS